MRQKSMTFISAQMILQKYKNIFIYILILSNFYQLNEKSFVIRHTFNMLYLS